jgi:hemoglobin
MRALARNGVTATQSWPRFTCFSRKDRSMRIVALGLALALGVPSVALTTACGGGKKTEIKAPTLSLYDRLGQKPAIEAVIDLFLANVVADTRINAAFAHLDADGVAHLRAMLIDQVCSATGGPCEYKGKSMLEVHTGMNITDDQFTAMVEDLVKALTDAKVQQAEQDELLGALGGMKGDIVGH